MSSRQTSLCTLSAEGGGISSRWRRRPEESRGALLSAAVLLRGQGEGHKKPESSSLTRVDDQSPSWSSRFFFGKVCCPKIPDSERKHIKNGPPKEKTSCESLVMRRL